MSATIATAQNSIDFLPTDTPSLTPEMIAAIDPTSTAEARTGTSHEAQLARAQIYLRGQMALLPNEYIGGPENKLQNPDDSLFSLREKRLIKYELLNGIIDGVAKEGNSVGQLQDALIGATYSLDALAHHITRPDFTYTMPSCADNYQQELFAKLENDIYTAIKHLSITEQQLILHHIAREVRYATDPNPALINHPRPIPSLSVQSPHFQLAEDLASDMQLLYYQELGNIVDDAKLKEHLDQMSRYLDFYFDPVMKTLRQRNKNVAVIAGPPAAGKGTTGEELRLETAASGTDGAAGRCGEKVVYRKGDTEVVTTRNAIVEHDEVIRQEFSSLQQKVAELQLTEHITPAEAKKKFEQEFEALKQKQDELNYQLSAITWYDRYDSFMKGFDRPRNRSRQIPNNVLTIMYADVLIEARRRLDGQGRFDDPVVLDGAPRNGEQAEKLLGGLNKEYFGGLFYQMVTEETAAIRGLGRAVESFARKGEIRPDELVGINFEQCPSISAYFTFTPARQLSDESVTLLTAIIATAQEQKQRIDITAQAEFRKILQNGESITLNRYENKKDQTDVQGRPSSRYWIYLDWKAKLIEACQGLGMNVVDFYCDQYDKATTAQYAAEAMGVAVTSY